MRPQTELSRPGSGISMLPSDWELINFIEEQGFVTFAQIRDRFFSGDKCRCSRRLKKMEIAGYLARRKLKDFFNGGRGGDGGKTYFPHLLNLNIHPDRGVFFINRGYAKGYGKSSQLFKTSMVLHQLLLNEIRIFIENRVVHKMMVNDPKIKVISNTYLGQSADTIPDLSVEYNHLKLAIEVERTPKGRSRYFWRFNQFRTSPYTHIIYYYTDEIQLKTLLNLASTDPRFAFAHYKNPDELYSNVFGIIDTPSFLNKKTKSL